MTPIRLLIVDDDDVDRERIRRLLRRIPLKTEARECGTAAEALALLPTLPFDCILLDYRLGEGTGLDLLRSLREVSVKPCPIIMVTGLGDQRVAVAAMREGVYDYLSKDGLEPDQLRCAIEDCLRRSELEQRLADAQARLERLSLYDDLTGLPNRSLFFRQLDQCLRNVSRGDAPFAVLMMDLNLFKQINDGLGHQVGDEVLAIVAKRMASVGRATDTVARLGGDEFAVLLPGTRSQAAAETFARKVVDAVGGPISVGETSVKVGISIGIALCPNHGTEREILMPRADQAMYQAKRGSLGYQTFRSTIAGAERRSVRIASLLPEALRGNQLTLHYQPKVDLLSGGIDGLEALVRWHSPELGQVCPGEFIPIAEDSALINPLTWSVLHMALAQCVRWQEDDWEPTLSVNLSVRLLDDEALPTKVMAALKTHGIPPERLILELTETALIRHPEMALQVTQGLIDYGIGVSIDDFGAGYTSFRFLRQLAISEIKIDRLFLSEYPVSARDRAIIRSISTLGAGFGLQVTAEGIEHLGMWPMLLDQGVRYGQGYAIARPMTAAAIDEWRRTWRAPSLRHLETAPSPPPYEG